MKQEKVKYLILNKKIKPGQKVFVLTKLIEKTSNTWFREYLNIKEVEVKNIKFTGTYEVLVSVFYEIFFEDLNTSMETVLDVSNNYDNIVESMKLYIKNHTEFYSFM